MVWIFIKEIYDYFIFDLWDLNYFEIVICLWLVYVYLVGIFLVVFVEMILVELYFYLVEIICINFFVFWIYDDCCLWFDDCWMFVFECWMVWNFFVNVGEVV